jgi:hypothetical protein
MGGVYKSIYKGMLLDRAVQSRGCVVAGGSISDTDGGIKLYSALQVTYRYAQKSRSLYQIEKGQR